MNLYEDLKRFAGNYFGFSSIISSQSQLITQLQSQAISNQSKIDELSKSLNAVLNSDESNKIKIQELMKKIESISKESFPFSTPAAKITYSRPVLIDKNTFKIAMIDVRSFIMKDFTIYDDLASHNLLYDGTQDLDFLIPKIYLLAKSSYQYTFDDHLGFSEFWLFPFELRTLKTTGRGGDCDDWSILIGSYFVQLILLYLILQNN